MSLEHISFKYNTARPNNLLRLMGLFRKDKVDNDDLKQQRQHQSFQEDLEEGEIRLWSSLSFLSIVVASNRKQRDTWSIVIVLLCCCWTWLKMYEITWSINSSLSSVIDFLLCVHMFCGVTTAANWFAWIRQSLFCWIAEGRGTFGPVHFVY